MEPSEDVKNGLLRATDSELKCLILGYLLKKRSYRTVDKLHSEAIRLVGKSRMCSRNAVRSHINSETNEHANLAEYVVPDIGDRITGFCLSAAGEMARPMAQFRLTQSLYHGVPLTGLYSNRTDQLKLLRCLTRITRGRHTLEDIAAREGMTEKPARAFIKAICDSNLAEKTKVKRGHGLLLAVSCNGRMHAYVDQAVRPLLNYLENPLGENTLFRRRDSFDLKEINEAIIRYEADTRRDWTVKSKS